MFDNGMDRSQIATEVGGLSKILMDTFLLATKTKVFHWNVVGSKFSPLHSMFDGQYSDLSSATDVIAERIRALGVLIDFRMATIYELSVIQDQPSIQMSQDDMVRILSEDHLIVARRIRDVIDQADDATATLLADRLLAHEKAAWMLRSSLE